MFMHVNNIDRTAQLVCLPSNRELSDIIISQLICEFIDGEMNHASHWMYEDCISAAFTDHTCTVPILLQRHVLPYSVNYQICLQNFLMLETVLPYTANDMALTSQFFLVFFLYGIVTVIGKLSGYIIIFFTNFGLESQTTNRSVPALHLKVRVVFTLS